MRFHSTRPELANFPLMENGQLCTNPDAISRYWIAMANSLKQFNTQSLAYTKCPESPTPFQHSNRPFSASFPSPHTKSAHDAFASDLTFACALRTSNRCCESHVISSAHPETGRSPPPEFFMLLIQHNHRMRSL